MPYPTLHDDGHTVTLDLHGLTVADALDLAVKVVREAARRGRARVRLIHGSSTSSRLERNRTIKHGLHDLLDRGAFSQAVTQVWSDDDSLLLALPIVPHPDPTRLSLLSLWR